MTTVKVSIPQIAKLIDHSLLQPTMTDEEILKGLKTARDLGTATA
jgi:deoxyribose-phosphate aldolase